MNRSYLGLLIASVALSSITGTGLLISTSTASLPENLEAIIQEVSQIADASWGIAVIEFKTGEERTLNANGQFMMQIPHLPLAAMLVELSNAGEISLDGLISRGEYYWERLHWAQQGGRGMCMAVIWTIGFGRINEWLAEKGYTGTEIRGVAQDVPYAPVFDSNYITAQDALGYLKIIYSSLDQASVRNIGTNPPLSDHIRETLGFDNTIYGWLDISEDSKLLFIIIDLPGDSDLGLVVLAEDIEDPADVDQGFRMLYEALTD